jgi:Conserved hypothetical protein (DUF2461)
MWMSHNDVIRHRLIRTERHETTEVEPDIGLLPAALGRRDPGGRRLPRARHRPGRPVPSRGRTGTQLVKVVEKLADEGYLIGGDKLKTKPRGYDADHPRIELLRHKSLTAERVWPPEPWVHTPAGLRPDPRLLGRHATAGEVDLRPVGPTTEPAR